MNILKIKPSPGDPIMDRLVVIPSSSSDDIAQGLKECGADHGGVVFEVLDCFTTIRPPQMQKVHTDPGDLILWYCPGATDEDLNRISSQIPQGMPGIVSSFPLTVEKVNVADVTKLVVKAFPTSTDTGHLDRMVDVIRHEVTVAKDLATPVGSRYDILTKGTE